MQSKLRLSERKTKFIWIFSERELSQSSVFSTFHFYYYSLSHNKKPPFCVYNYTIAITFLRSSKPFFFPLVYYLSYLFFGTAYMTTIYLGREAASPQPCVATIGFFDGVHRGHQFLMAQVLSDARKHAMASTVVTFDRHPREVLGSNFQPQLLTTLDEKLMLMEKTGVEQTVILPFSEQMASLSAHDFMQRVMVEKLNVRRLVIGYDNRFGHNREECFDDYVRYGRELGVEVVQAEAFPMSGVNVSSSMVRSFLMAGETEMAGRCLGYPYFVQGRVVSGQQEGRRLGFPTANIEPDSPRKLIPAPGVYAVKVHVGADPRVCPETLNGMMNIGTRPTFDGHQQTLEVHIFQFDGNLYGDRILVSFHRRIREERRFENPSQLKQQLKRDALQAQAILNKDFDI